MVKKCGKDWAFYLPNLTISESEVLLAKMICLPIISIRIDNDKKKCDVIPPELFEKCIRKKCRHGTSVIPLDQPLAFSSVDCSF